MTTHIYRPILKSRAGELTALDNLQATAKARTVPIFQVTASVAASFTKNLVTAWTGRSVGLDGHFSFNVTGSTSTFTGLAGALRAGGVTVIPSVRMNASPSELTAVRALYVSAPTSGVIVRGHLQDLANLNTFLTLHSYPPSEVDFVLDLEDMSGMAAQLLAPVVVSTIQSSGLSSPPLRSFTLAASAAPKDFGALPRGASTVPRRDWQLWSSVAPQVGFQLDYADYGIGHPDLTEPPGSAMAKATVSARYTLLADWVVHKGFATSGASGLPMNTQYRGHANSIASHAQFGGVAGCWADGQISRIASGAGTSGNRTTWAGLALNRHIEVVLSQLP